MASWGMAAQMTVIYHQIMVLCKVSEESFGKHNFKAAVKAHKDVAGGHT